MNKSKLTRKEAIISATVFIIIFLVLSRTLYLFNIGGQLGDGTFAAQILYNFKQGNFEPITSFGFSIGEYLNNVLHKSADYVCSQPLTFTKNSGFIGHNYYIMYALIPLAQIFDTYQLVAGLQAMIYTSILAFTYYFSRDRKLSILNSVLLTILVSQHPLWRYGLFGQFYFNRLFIPFVALAIWLMTRRKINYVLLVVVTILALSVNEITGITMLMIFLVYATFFKNKDRKLIILGLAAGLFSLLSMVYIQQKLGPISTQTSFIDNTFSSDIVATFNNLLNNATSNMASIYLFVNLAYLGILAIAVPINFLFVIVFLLPNLFVYLGGAEKTGWSTHYHVNYFIPLIWLGIASLGKLKVNNKYVIPLLLVILIALSSIINPEDLSTRAKPVIEIKNVINKVFYHNNHAPYDLDYKNKLREAVGEINLSVSAPEAAVYNLIDHDTYYYPINIDSVDRVIFRYYEEYEDDGKFTSINYGGQIPNLDKCIIERMKKNGFDFDNPTFVYPWAIIGKTPQSQE